ncbi:TolB-like translocation protein [Pedobacter arcticus]|uniref:hypothetical protein n=1 Tax=Pedobacter arcticus TaxID=752140 RepID=UPI00031CA840|nr:hypothetical protein [Pedobacter arcticus]
MIHIISNKLIIISVLTTIFLTTTSLNGFSQFIDGGQNPPSVKFKQINTPNFQIIYPTLFESEAQRMANTLEILVKQVSKTLGHQPKPISIIFQNQGVVSNGFVTMAPRHSEFYTMPGQEFDAQDWLNSLAVHELRHVVQFDKIGPNLGAPLFEELKLALFGINLPAWFFEGDAVGIETALTPAGRGRQPAFEMVLRTNELSEKKYSYSKNHLGSYRNLTPGYYPLGYFMTTKIRRDNGALIFDQILERIKNFPIRPYNFSSSLKKFSGIHTQKLYKNTMTEMDSLWKNQSNKLSIENYEPLNKISNKNPSSYLLPYLAKNNQIICLKTSLSEPTKIISIDEQKNEKLILKIGAQTEPNLSYANGVITWDEYRSDSRYEQRNYSVICTYNLAIKQYKQLSKKSRLFSPSLSPDGKKIIAVNVTSASIFSLVELDAETGKTVRNFPNPKNYTLQTPTYSVDGSEIVVTGVSQNGKTLLRYSGNHIEELLDPQPQLISRPSFYGDQIIYKAHYNGIENIYQLNPKTKVINQLTHVQFGANYPTVTNQKLYFSTYTAQGYNLTSADLSSTESISDKLEENTFVNYFSPLITQENKPNILEETDSIKYVSQKYRELDHLFYFHSARLTVTESNYNNEYDFGLSLISNNKLNTAFASVGYLYNNALNTSEFNANFTYQKFYPKIVLGYKNRAQLAYAKTGDAQNPTLVPFYWRENRTSLSINVPTYKNWLNKSFYTDFTVATSYTNRYQETLKPANFYSDIKFPMSYTFTTGINTRKAARDLAPKWGQNIEFNFEHTPLDKNLNGINFNFKSAFYFPGFLPNHSFKTSINFQKSDGIYQYSNDIPRANGWANMAGIADLKNTLLLSYRFPIAYPDWELGPIAYIKRIKGGVFTDFENINAGNGLRGYGAGLSADMNLLRYYLPIFEIGSKIIIPNESITKKPILEFSFTFNY